MTADIKGFFNPTKQGDTFKGLNSSIEGEVADRIIPDLPTFLKAARRDYYIKKVPAYQKFGTEFAEVENQFHLVRSSDERVVSPHTVTESYAPLSLVDIAEEVQPWCEAGWCTPDGVYSGKNESLELLTLRLDAAGNLPNGEVFKHYIAFQNPHAAGGKAKGKILDFRVVCGNTFAAAIRSVSDFTITHRVAEGDAEEQKSIMVARAKDAIAAWSAVQDHIKKLAEKINVWSAIPLQNADVLELSNRLVGITDEDDASTRAKNRRDAIVAAYNMPKFGTYGRTAYDWLNGVTFVNSSPLAEINAKSKVSAIDRAIRTMDTNGTGFAFELKAEELLAELVA